MIKRWLRGLIREELEEMRSELISALVDTVAENNEQIEQDLIEAGVLERRKNGELRAAVGERSIAK